MEQTNVLGPHQRAGRRRRRWKALVILALLLILAVTSSMSMFEKSETSDPPPGKIAYAKNLYRLTGYNGEAKAIIDQYPEYREYITGEKEIPSGWHQTGQN